MVEFTDIDDVEDFFETQDRSHVVAMVASAAIRSLPSIMAQSNPKNLILPLPLFRSAICVWVSQMYRDTEIDDACRHTQAEVYSFSSSRDRSMLLVTIAGPYLGIKIPEQDNAVFAV
tara:strand:+ start:39 stop:389 length:351 start_codon:yes stop_codon:yes gene_type:complete